ncbi:MAG: hypothetical protein ABI679_12870 [Gemmatimonadota bacterium]
MTSAQPPRPSTASERDKLIAEYEQSKHSEHSRHIEAGAAAARNRRLRRSAILGLVTVAAVYLWFFPPAWLTPEPLPVPSASEREAGTRFAIFLQAQQIDHFRATMGRLPSTASEAGEPLPGIDYIVLSPTTYALQSVHDSAIRYASTDSLQTFLGSSAALLGHDQGQ